MHDSLSLSFRLTGPLAFNGADLATPLAFVLRVVFEVPTLLDSTSIS